MTWVFPAHLGSGMIRRLIIILALLLPMVGQAGSRIITVDGHPLQVTQWPASPSGDMVSHRKTVVLLSGPIDSWHSDSAWWAALGPELAKHYRVIAVDRAGIGTMNAAAPVGYAHLAKDLKQLFEQLNLKKVTVVAFASSNLSLHAYFKQYANDQVITGAILIDPDVLTDFSIDRYKADAKPFKDKLQPYLDYIGEGKYLARVEQKNQADKEAMLAALPPENSVDWHWVDEHFKRRTEIVHQQNLFKEIARYGDDLDIARQQPWPRDVPVIVIDTDFEQHYIDATQDADEKAGLIKWQQDAKDYYQQLVQQATDGTYLDVSSEDKGTLHLYQLAYPAKIIELVNKITQ